MRAQPFTGAVMSALVVCCATGLARGADVSAPPRATMAQVRRAWQARQDRIRTARFAWSVDRFIAARSRPRVRHGATPETVQARDPGKDTEWIPERDLTFKSLGTMSLSANMLRYVDEGLYWHPDLGELRERKYITTFDGETAQSLYAHAPPWPHDIPLVGFIHREPRHPEVRNRLLEPMLLAFRPCDPNMGGVDVTSCEVSAKTGILDRVSCIILAPTALSRGQTSFWLDPERDFIILRVDQRNAHGDVLMQIDISWQQDSRHGWLPRGWKVVSQEGFSKIVEQATAIVTQYEINVDIPRAEFQISFPAGTVVRSLKAKEDYLVKEDQTRRAITRDEIRRHATYDEYLNTESGLAGLNSRRSTFELAGWMVAGALLLMAIALFWRFRRAWRRRESHP